MMFLTPPSSLQTLPWTHLWPSSPSQRSEHLVLCTGLSCSARWGNKSFDIHYCMSACHCARSVPTYLSGGKLVPMTVICYLVQPNMASVAQTTTFWETLSSASWLPNATTAKQKLHSNSHAHPPHSYTLSPPAQCWQALRCLYQPREIQSPVGFCLKWNQLQKRRRAGRNGASARVLLKHPLLPQVWRRNLFLRWGTMRGRW